MLHRLLSPAAFVFIDLALAHPVKWLGCLNKGRIKMQLGGGSAWIIRIK